MVYLKETTEKPENCKSAYFKRKISNMDLVLNIERVNEFNLLKEEVE